MIGVWLGASALAVDVSAGVGLSLVADLPDPAPLDATRWSLGGGLVVPVWLGLTDRTSVRLGFRGDHASGVDQLTWTETIAGVDHRFVSDGHTAWLGLFTLAAGPEVRVPVGDHALTFALEGGGGAAATWHAMDLDSQVLLGSGPGLDDPGHLDPYAWSPAVAGFATVGFAPPWPIRFEVTFASAYVQGAGLTGAPVPLDARREAFAATSIRPAILAAF